MLKSPTDSLTIMMLASTSGFLLLLLGMVALVSYYMIDLTYDIASNASGEQTQAPFIAMAKFESESKCFWISSDDTVPDDAILNVRLDTVNAIADYRGYYWQACFDSQIQGDIFVSGIFAEEEKEFGPYNHVWGLGTIESGDWKVEVDTGPVGIIINPMEGTFPANFSDIDYDMKYEAISFIAEPGSMVTISNPNYLLGRVMDPFSLDDSVGIDLLENSLKINPGVNFLIVEE